MSLCDHIQEQLSGYVDAELSPDERRLVHEHLAECQVCRHRLETLQRVAGHVRNLPELEAPPELLINVSREIRRGTGEDRSTDCPGLFRSWRIVRLASAAAALLLASYVGVHVFESTVVAPAMDGPAVTRPTTPQDVEGQVDVADGDRALQKSKPARAGVKTETLLPQALAAASAPVEVRRITIRTRNVTEAVQTVQGLTLARGEDASVLADDTPSFKARRSEGAADAYRKNQQDPPTGTFIQSAPDRVVLVMDHDLARAQFAVLEGAFKADNVTVEDVELKGDRTRLQELAEAARVAAVDAEVSDRLKLKLKSIDEQQRELDRVELDENDRAEDDRMKRLAGRARQPRTDEPAPAPTPGGQIAGRKRDTKPADKPARRKKAITPEEAAPPSLADADDGATRGDSNDVDAALEAKDTVRPESGAQGSGGGAVAGKGGHPSREPLPKQSRIVIWEVNFVAMETDRSVAPK